MGLLGGGLGSNAASRVTFRVTVPFTPLALVSYPFKFAVISDSDPNYCTSLEPRGRCEYTGVLPSLPVSACRVRVSHYALCDKRTFHLTERKVLTVRPSDPLPPSDIVRGLGLPHPFRFSMGARPLVREREASEESHNISGVSDPISDRLHKEVNENNSIRMAEDEGHMLCLCK
jgi:hypothetical protein